MCSTELADRFDTELFIDEVEKRPAIWNFQSDEYGRKNAKNQAWQELVEIFGSDEDTMEKKAILGVSLEKKWKNIRDCYKKENNKGKTTPSGSGARKGSHYIYFSRLSFLQKSVENRKTTNNMNMNEQPSQQQPDEDNNETSEVNANATEATEMPPPKRKKKIVPEERISELLEKSIETRQSLKNELQENSVCRQDDDKLFCLSLYKELKTVPENRRLATKIEMLQVIQKGQALPTPLRFSNQHTNSNQQILPNTSYWQMQQPQPQGYFTAVNSPISPGSPSPSSQFSSASHTSDIKGNLYEQSDADFD